MVSSLTRSLTSIGRKWKPLSFSKQCNPRIAFSERIEEETLPDYVSSRYDPANIGEVFGKRYVVLKLFITSSSLGQYLDDEINIYKRLQKPSQVHPGRRAIRQLLDTFELEGPDGQHRCLVHPIYTSRDLRLPKKWGAPVLCDLGSAIPGDVEHTEDIQPDIYRAPGVILEVPWSYEVDIWNAGCMVWDLFEGERLFAGHDAEVRRYRSRAHLAEVVALLGPPPAELLAKGSATSRFFNKEGILHADIARPDAASLEDRETSLVGVEDRQLFLDLMRKMLQ